MTTIWHVEVKDEHYSMSLSYLVKAKAAGYAEKLALEFYKRTMKTGKDERKVSPYVAQIRYLGELIN